MNTSKLSIIMIFSFILCISVSCKKEQTKEAAPHGTITFTAGDVLLNKKEALVGDQVTKQNTVTTGKESIAVIQFSQTALITVKSDSEVTMESFFTKKGADEELTISQSRGTSFSKVLKKGTKYQVKTPTIVASVRGTSFEVAMSGEKAQVSLLKGKLDVAPIKAGKVEIENTIAVEDGFTIEITEYKIEKPVEIPAEEKSALEQFDKIALLPDIEKVEKIREEKEKTPEKPAETDSLEQISSQVVPKILKLEIIKIEQKEEAKRVEESKDEPEKDAKADNPAVKKKPTIADLKKKYGTLSRIKTKDGKEYIGAFSQTGSKMEINTVNGKVSIDSKNVGKISRFK
ncbi:MAG: FecR domain-containing protein [bacterium]|nr:FecR domain-containing protein [bacterium]